MLKADRSIAGALTLKLPRKTSGRDLYDWLMLGIGAVGTVAVVATIIIGRIDQASNGRDVKSAIEEMAAIAKAMHDQQPVLSAQAKALTDTAAAAQITADASSHQAEDFKRQTTAVVKQADALIAGARATVTAARAELASAQANIKTAEAGSKAAEEQLRSAQILAAGQAPAARLVRIEWQGLEDAPQSDGTVKITVKPIYMNTGGGDLTPIYTTFNLVISDTISNLPPSSDQNAFGGNELHVAPTREFYPIEPFIYKFPASMMGAARAGQKAMFVWGVILFKDVSGKDYRVCYGAVARGPSKANSQGAVLRFGPDTYHCGGG